MKKQKVSGQSSSKGGKLSPQRKEKLKTDEPLSEKDEVKQAEEEQRKRNLSKFTWSFSELFFKLHTKIFSVTKAYFEGNFSYTFIP
jgi:hypothetical protein